MEYMYKLVIKIVLILQLRMGVIIVPNVFGVVGHCDVSYITNCSLGMTRFDIFPDISRFLDFYNLSFNLQKKKNNNRNPLFKSNSPRSLTIYTMRPNTTTTRQCKIADISIHFQDVLGTKKSKFN